MHSLAQRSFRMTAFSAASASTISFVAMTVRLNQLVDEHGAALDFDKLLAVVIVEVRKHHL